MKRSTSTLSLACIVVLILGGFALRLYRINVVPLRGDEAFTVIHWMREPFAQTLADITTRDPQPPLAYATYRLYALVVGSSEYQVRFLPALLNLLGVAALYGLGSQIGGRRLGLLAALLYAIHPYEIWHAQDARNYAVWAALSPLALWLALRALKRRRLIDWALYVVAAVVTLYFYYLELFVVFVLNLYVLLAYRRDRPLLVRWYASQAAIALMILPWYLQERLLTGSGYGGTATRFDPTLWFREFIPTLAFGSITADQIQHLPPWVMVFALAVLVAVLLAGGWVVWRKDGNKAVLLSLLGTVPLVLLGIVSLKLSVFTPRYVLSVTPVYIILLGSVLLTLWDWRRRKAGYGIVCLAFGVVLFGINANGLVNYYFNRDYAKSPDWRSLASYLHERTGQNDLVLNTSADEAFTLYHTDYDVAGDQIRLPANPEQSAAEIEQVLGYEAGQYQSIWLAAQTPPNWANNGLVEAWLADYMQRVRQTSANGLRAQQYMTWDVQPIETPALATFGDIVELADAQVLPQEPTATLTIWLYWRPLETTSTPLKVFVHLLSAPDTPPVAQADSFPQAGRISTTSWQQGTLYRDVYDISLAGVPAGAYDVSVGFYDPETNVRIPVGDSDHAIIGTITIYDYAKE